MKEIQDILDQIKIHIKPSTGTTSSYQCNICQDTGVIMENKDGYQYAKECQCQEKQKYLRILKNSGISDIFINKSFENYLCDNEERKQIKQKALSYVKNFKDTSFLSLGQVGSGKTHITIAIANELMKLNIPVRYAQYGRMVNELLTTRKDEINYNQEANKYKNAKVILIDDLFKGAINDWDNIRKINSRHIDVIFDIINYRYLNNKPIIVSCELLPNQLLDLDEGIASRLLEMAQGNIVAINNKQMNYRLFKAV